MPSPDALSPKSKVQNFLQWPTAALKWRAHAPEMAAPSLRETSGIKKFANSGGMKSNDLWNRYMSAYDPSQSRSALYQSDLIAPRTDQDPTQNADGTLLSNVLYAIPANDRPALLSRIFNDLKPGSIFVINDPKPETQQSAEALRSFLEKIFSDAVRNGSPLTEFELAFLAEVNRAQLTANRETNPFLRPEELEKLLTHAGFKILARKSTYYHQAQMVIAQKPARK